MPPKEIIDVRQFESYIEQTVIVTQDQQHYVFVRLPWMEMPMFSHRFVPNPDGGDEHRTYTNRLPQSVEAEAQERWGGFCRMKIEEVKFA